MVKNLKDFSLSRGKVCYFLTSFKLLSLILSLFLIVQFIPISFVQAITPGGMAYIEYFWPLSNDSDNSHSGFYNFDLCLKIDAVSNNSYYFWAYQFKFANGDGGYLGLQLNGNKKIALFSVWGAKEALPGPGGYTVPFDEDGEGWSCRLPYEWRVGRTYKLRIWELCCAENPSDDEWWGAWIIDAITGEERQIGSVRVDGSWDWLDTWSVAWVEYFGDVENCQKVPYSRASFTYPFANNGGYIPNYTKTSYGNTCTNVNIIPTDHGFILETGLTPTPKLNVSPKEFNMGNVKQGEVISINFFIENIGNGILSGSVDIKTKGTVKLSQHEFRLNSQEKIAIYADIITNELSSGYYNYELYISSNGGDLILPIRFNIITNKEVIIKELDDSIYINQINDVPEDFNGEWACAPCSAVMFLSYLKKLTPVWFKSQSGYKFGYGYYVSKIYTYTRSDGTKITFDDYYECEGHEGCGAWGYIWKDDNNKGSGYGVSSNIVKYIRKHEIIVESKKVDEETAKSEVKKSIDNDIPLIARTGLWSGGHYVLIIGYSENNNEFEYITFDPGPKGNIRGDGKYKRYSYEDLKRREGNFFYVYTLIRSG